MTGKFTRRHALSVGLGAVAAPALLLQALELSEVPASASSSSLAACSVPGHMHCSCQTTRGITRTQLASRLH